MPTEKGKVARRRKPQLERLDWIEERLESFQGQFTEVNQTLNNHMNDYRQELATVNQNVEQQVKNLNDKFNYLLAITLVAMAGLLSLAAAVIVKFLGG